MAVDTLLDNRYAINDADAPPLDKGGMAIIYAGTDTSTGDPVAAKTLLPAYQGDTGRRQRFRNEAEVLKAVQHEHIVTVLDVIDGRNGTWIVMEQLEGQNLRQKLASEGAFRPEVVDRWLTQAAEALTAMHALGYVHLDVSPQNLFLCTQNTIKLIDFGIAQKADRVPRREGGKLLGTAAYIAPEHASGQVVTPAADIYSLGCVVFELLTGRPAFSERAEQDADSLLAIRQSAVPELPTAVAPDLNLPAWVDTVLAKAIMPRAEERYASVAEFAAAFHSHVRPVLFSWPWPTRRATRAEVIAAPTREVASALTETQLQPEPRDRRAPSLPMRWVYGRLRSARRALVVVALLAMMALGVPTVGLPALMDWSLGALPGSGTQTVQDSYYLRTAPGTSAEIRALIPLGTSIEVTGTPEKLNDGLWWPVRLSLDGVRHSGWLHEDAFRRTWMMDRAVDTIALRDDIKQEWDDATDWLPG